MAIATVAILSLVVIGPVYVRVSVIIPSHNEAQAIERVVTDLPSDLATEVIVVDSNSNDGTPEIAAGMGARVVQEPRRGYGRACLTGLAAANSPDVVVFLDGDYSDRPSELPILLAPIMDGRADITLGSRLQDRRSAVALPWHQAAGNRLAASLIKLLYGLEISDLGPFRAGRAEVLRALDGGTPGIDGPIQVAPGSLHANVGFVHPPGLVGRLEMPSQSLLQLRAIFLHPAPDRFVIDMETEFRCRTEASQWHERKKTLKLRRPL